MWPVESEVVLCLLALVFALVLVLGLFSRQIPEALTNSDLAVYAWAAAGSLDRIDAAIVAILLLWERPERR